MSVELINPCGEFTHVETPLAPRPGLGVGTTVGLFHNDKKNADVLVDDVARLLERRHGGLKFQRFGKPASDPADFTSGFLGECDVVVTALAD